MRKGSDGGLVRKGVVRRTSGKPKSTQIFETLQKRIAESEYSSEGLPPELTLMSEFQVSRHTIRSAMQRLVVEGLIERRRGIGTTVVRRDPAHASWGIASLDDLVGSFHAADLLFAGPVVARDHPEIARFFGVLPDDVLFKVVRVLRSTQGIQMHSTIYTRLEFGMRVPRDRIGSQFFLTLLEEHCGVRAARARQIATAAIPPEDVRQPLGLEVGEPALVLQRAFVSRSGESIEYTHTYCRPDTYPQVVDFYREDEMPNKNGNGDTAS